MNNTAMTLMTTDFNNEEEFDLDPIRASLIGFLSQTKEEAETVTEKNNADLFVEALYNKALAELSLRNPDSQHTITHLIISLLS